MMLAEETPFSAAILTQVSPWTTAYCTGGSGVPVGTEVSVAVGCAVKVGGAVLLGWTVVVAVACATAVALTPKGLKPEIMSQLSQTATPTAAPTSTRMVMMSQGDRAGRLEPPRPGRDGVRGRALVGPVPSLTVRSAPQTRHF